MLGLARFVTHGNSGGSGPSLNFNFVDGSALSPQITFTRASTATFYDGKTVAKAEENLLFPSLVSTFGVSAWVANGTATSTPNNATAPDGSVTATTISTTGAGGARLTRTTLAGTYTVSCWVRSVSGNTEFQTDFENGNVGTLTLTADWQRHVSTQTLSAQRAWIDFQIAGTGVFEIWGAQLEQRSSVTAYTPTTTQPITNYIPVLLAAPDNVARFDHNPTTGESLGLLIEEQRTNLLTYSENFADAAWTKTRSSITANTIVAPDGTLTGDKLVENTDNNSHVLIRSSLSFTSGTAYTLSAYFKAGERVSCRLLFGVGFSTSPTAFFNISTGTISQNPSGNSSSASIAAVGNGWYRVSITATCDATTAAGEFTITLVTGTTTVVYQGDGYSGIYIWGAQLEAGAFPTSYIPTVASQVTRNADAASMTGTNFSSWFNNGQGTLYAEADTNELTLTTFSNVVSIWDGTSSNRILLRSSSTTADSAIVTNGVAQALLNKTGVVSSNVAYKAALAFARNDVAYTANGLSAASTATTILPIVNQMTIGGEGVAGSLSGHIRRITYYPRRLTDAQLQQITA